MHGWVSLAALPISVTRQAFQPQCAVNVGKLGSMTFACSVVQVPVSPRVDL